MNTVTTVALLALTAAITGVLGVVGDANATPDFTAAEQSWLDQNPTISVGAADWPPYEYVDSNGNLAGVTGEIAKRFSSITGANFVKSDVAGSWSQTLAGLKDGTVDVEFMIENTGSADTSRQGIAYTDSWSHIPTHIIVKQADRGTVTSDNLDSKRLVTVDGYAINSWLDSEGITYSTVSSTAAALRGVVDGTYDAHLENWNVAQRISADNNITGLVNTGLTGHVYKLSIGYTEGEVELGSILQKVLKEEDVVVSAIAEFIKGTFTSEENRWLGQNPTISVGAADWPPYEYVDSNGNLAGVTGEIAKRFSSITGANFVKSDVAGSWSQTLAGLKDGTVDVEFMIENTGSADTSRQGIAYTDSWSHIPTHIIVKQADRGTVTSDNLDSKRLVTVDGYAINSWLDSEGITYSTVSSTAAALRGVVDGTYDAHLENWNVAQRISADNNITGLVDTGETGHTYELSIGYTQGNTVLGGILQKILDGIGGQEQLIEEAVERSNADLRPRVCR